MVLVFVVASSRQDSAQDVAQMLLADLVSTVALVAASSAVQSTSAEGQVAAIADHAAFLGNASAADD